MSVKCPIARLGKNGRTISVEEAKRRGLLKGTLFCLDPECNTPVFPRVGVGGKRRPHFAHHNDADTKRCKGGLPCGETMNHLISKHFVAANNAKCYFVDWDCSSCGRVHGVRGTWDMDPSVEHRVDVGGGKFRVADVMLLDKAGKAVYAVEIKHTHAVDSDKRLELLARGIKVLEVDAEVVLAAKDGVDLGRVSKGSLAYCLSLVDFRSIQCDDCIMKTATLVEMKEWYSHEKGYMQEWEDWVNARIEEEEISANQKLHKSFQSTGIRHAKRQIKEMESRHEFRSSQYQKDNSFKCVGCTKWRPNETRVLIDFDRFCTYGKFVEMHQHRKFIRPESYKEWQAQMCSFCYMDCPECEEPCTMQQLSIYGCCYGCNKC